MRKNLIIVIPLALAAIAPAATLATPGASERASQTFSTLDADNDGQLDEAEIPSKLQALFARLVRTSDDNGDGRISPDEYAAGTHSERPPKQPVVKQGSRTLGADALVVILSQLDADGDRVIEADESPPRYRLVTQQLLQRGDQDKDGRLTGGEIARSSGRLGGIAVQAARRMGLDVQAELERLPRGVRAQWEQLNGANRGAELTDPKRAQQMFQRLDANGDGHIEEDEVPEAAIGRFDQMSRLADANDDGRISRDEFMAGTRRLAQMQKDRPSAAKLRRTVTDLLERFDVDDDGKISRSEALGQLAKRFDQADADQSGQLEEQELSRIAERFARITGAKKRRRPQPQTD